MLKQKHFPSRNTLISTYCPSRQHIRCPKSLVHMCIVLSSNKYVPLLRTLKTYLSRYSLGKLDRVRMYEYLWLNCYNIYGFVCDLPISTLKQAAAFSLSGSLTSNA